LVRKRAFALASTLKKAVIKQAYHCPLPVCKRKQRCAEDRRNIKELEKKVKAQQTHNKQQVLTHSPTHSLT
jgi:hypothetical protein